MIITQNLLHRKFLLACDVRKKTNSCNSAQQLRPLGERSKKHRQPRLPLSRRRVGKKKPKKTPSRKIELPDRNKTTQPTP